jgi:NAD(P)-dependent dehydrogenase (short-subunit alcohol dehydrogenase family)
MATGTAMITGAGRGLGAELCRAYLRRGWHVLGIVRDEHTTEPQDRYHPIVVDIAAPGAGAVIERAAAALTGHVDILVNNAGIGGVADRLADVRSEELWALWAVHCLGTVQCTQAVLPLLRASAGPKVVNVTSRVASFARWEAGEFAGEAVSYAYRMAKAAQNMATLAMSQELGPEGVVVCAVHPGEFASGLNPDGSEEAAVVATRLVEWMDGIGADHNGGWFDPRSGRIPW